MKLNMGASRNWHAKGWTVLDHKIENRREYGDAANLPFDDESCSVVFTSHMTEHIPHLKIDKVLSEINRVLKPNGVLRLLSPDLEKIAKAYASGDEKFFQLASSEDETMRTDLGFGGMLANFIVSPGQDTALFNRDLTEFIGGYAHLYLYDFKMLNILLGKHGFKDIKQMPFCESEINDFKEPLHVEGFPPVWQNINREFYSKHNLIHEYKNGTYHINFKFTGFDRNPVHSLIVEAKKEKHTGFNSTTDCKNSNYNRYGYSLLEIDSFKKSCYFTTEVNKVLKFEKNKDIQKRNILKLVDQLLSDS